MKWKVFDRGLARKCLSTSLVSGDGSLDTDVVIFNLADDAPRQELEQIAELTLEVGQRVEVDYREV